jgi:hypothetical protein
MPFTTSDNLEYITNMVNTVIDDGLAVDPDTPDMYDPLKQEMIELTASYMTDLVHHYQTHKPKSSSKSSKNSKNSKSTGKPKKKSYSTFVSIMSAKKRGDLDDSINDTLITPVEHYANNTSPSAVRYASFKLDIEGKEMNLGDLHDIIKEQKEMSNGMCLTGVVWGLIETKVREDIVARWRAMQPAEEEEEE